MLSIGSQGTFPECPMYVGHASCLKLLLEIFKGLPFPLHDRLSAPRIHAASRIGYGPVGLHEMRDMVRH